MRNYIYGLLIFVFQFHKVALFPDVVCPHLCQPCFKETVVCSTPGRINLPEQISLTVQKLTITDQRFFVTTLTTENFTQFAPPHISLKQLFIRNCNVQKIESRAFSALTKLESLDLSNNSNLTISNDAFNGLKIRHLIINNINILVLEKDVFRGLDVTSLSLMNCGIESIGYNTLHPLIKSLSKLFLQENHIKTLEPKLGLIFQQLDSLELSENLFHCNCSIKWLSDFYKQRRNDPNFNDNKFQNGNIIPKCVSPYYLANRFLTHVNNEELICENPKISELNLKLNSLSNAKLVCSGYQASWQAPMQISWYNESSVGEQMDSEIFINQTKSSKTVSVKYIKDIGHYKCVINNSLGEATAIVRIDWPNFFNTVSGDGEFEPIIRDTLSPNVKMKTWRTVFFERRFTLLEIIAAITGTVLFTGLLFILIHRFIMIKCVWVKKKNSGKKSRQSNLATLSLTTSYEPAIYSNSQTYDLPGVGHTGSNLYLPATANSSQQFLDFKTQRKIYRKL